MAIASISPSPARKGQRPSALRATAYGHGCGGFITASCLAGVVALATGTGTIPVCGMATVTRPSPSLDRRVGRLAYDKGVNAEVTTQLPH